LIHRDLKPENMLIDPDGRLRITDFGLALALRGSARFGGATSRSGTPQFAAPEQLLGERVDQRADLYSLSAVAYFGLLGRAPFGGKTPEQILAKQRPTTCRRCPPNGAMCRARSRTSCGARSAATRTSGFTRPAHFTPRSRMRLEAF